MWLAGAWCHHPTAHSPRDPEEIGHLVSVRRRTTPLQDLLRPRRPRSQCPKAALQLHPSPSGKRSLPTGYCAHARAPGRGCLWPGPDPRLGPRRPEAGAAPARRPGARVCWGIPRSRSSGVGPGMGFRSQGGGHCGLGPENLKCLKGELRLPSGRQRKHPHLCHRDPRSPAAKKLPITFPPHALPTQTHTNTPIPCAAASRGGGGGRKRTGRKGSQLPFQAGSRAPGKAFPPTGASETCTRRVPRPPNRSTGAEGRRFAFLGKGVGLS